MTEQFLVWVLMAFAPGNVAVPLIEFNTKEECTQMASVYVSHSADVGCVQLKRLKPLPPFRPER